MRFPSDKLVIAFFGQGAADSSTRRIAVLWSEWTKSVATELEVRLTHIDAMLVAKVKGVGSHRPYNLRRYENRILREVECGNACLLDLNAMEDAEGYIAFDWVATSSAGVHPGFGSIALLGLDTRLIAGWSGKRVREFLHRCSRKAMDAMRVDYGFAVVMPRQHFPAGYAIGIASGASGHRLVIDATAWRRFARRECRSYLRNVYGWNLLSSDHLQFKLGGVDLQGWIESAPERGTLEAVGAGNALWSFDDGAQGTEFLRWDFGPSAEARHALEGYGLFPWQRLAELEAHSGPSRHP